MSAHPIDVIANEIRAAGHVAAGVVAERVAKALDDERIVQAAVAALIEDGWRHGHEGPNGQSEQTDEDLANIARAVLRSVGGV